MTGRALRRYVEDLLHGRRPRGFAATDDDVATLQAAITLQAARPGADAPRAEFVDALQQRLAAEFEDAPPLRTAAWGIGRRGLLAGGAAVAAASAAIGVVVDRTLLTGRAGANRGHADPESAGPGRRSQPATSFPKGPCGPSTWAPSSASWRAPTA